METEFFEVIMKRLERDPALVERAEAMLSAVSVSEPLIADTLNTPQDIRFHNEGPFVRDHLRLMLVTLYAIVEGKLHLREIEELTRLKGYEIEIEQLEERFKEQVSWFEAFVFCHDAAKWSSVVFRAKEKTRGDALGFNTKLTYEPDVDFANRATWRKAYLDLYREFETMHPNESPQEIQMLFYMTYEIDVSYPHHDRLIHTPVYRSLLQRFMIAHKLSDVHSAMLEDVISHHLALSHFEKPETSSFSRFAHLARVRHYDLDEFVDFIQGALFLDFVAASKHASAHGSWFAVEMLSNALRAEHEVDPTRRVEKMHARQEQEHRERLRLFQEVGLDGMSLLDLLEMDPGPQFGRILKQVQEAVVGKNEMPRFEKKKDAELSFRVGEYYKKMFVSENA